MKDFRTGKRKGGFTLVEVIVVAAILSILAAIAIPVFIDLSGKARQGTDIASATEIANAINLYNYGNPDTKVTQADVNGWTSQDDMKAKLGDLTPIFAPDNLGEAIKRVLVDDVTGVATVITTID